MKYREIELINTTPHIQEAGSHWHSAVHVCVILCSCVFAMFCMKMLNFHVLYACILLICIIMGIYAVYVFL